MDPPPQITLTPTEERVRQLLVDAAEHIDRTLPPDSIPSKVKTDEPLTLRFTGGWVRDKLLGGQCNDIDVGINKMTGYEFATKLGDFMMANYEKYNIDPRHVHKIACNPEKSKHLETATTRMLGLDIDFVNLRCETYNSGSRIPNMDFGTPREDALRRDACVNALFYNIHTHEVEDWTECGLNDMKNMLIRTPLEPKATFDDDPLRILRLIRFASRLGFTIVDEAKKAMMDSKIQEALRVKISRERVGVEVEKMLKGPNPYQGITLIYTLNLYHTIFNPPTETLPETIPLPKTIPSMSQSTAALQHLLTATETPYSSLRTLLSTSHERFIAWLLAALTPWKQYTFPGADQKKDIPGAATAAREGLKLNNKLHSTIVSSYRRYNKIAKFVEEMAGSEVVARGKTGLFIRDLGPDWRSQYLLSLLVELLTTWPLSPTPPPSHSSVSSSSSPSPSPPLPLPQASPTPDPASIDILTKYSRVLTTLTDLDLLNVTTIQPVLNGKEMMVVLEQKRAGPWMKEALDRLVAWQLDNVEKGKEEAEVWVRENKEMLLGKGR